MAGADDLDMYACIQYTNALWSLLMLFLLQISKRALIKEVIRFTSCQIYENVQIPFLFSCLFCEML